MRRAGWPEMLASRFLYGLNDFLPILSRLYLKNCVGLAIHTQESAVLEMRPNCESCNCDLPADSTEAHICSFECTFCASCASNWLEGHCPNCSGELVPRPRRPQEKLQKFPASSKRIIKPIAASAANEAS